MRGFPIHLMLTLCKASAAGRRTFIRFAHQHGAAAMVLAQSSMVQKQQRPLPAADEVVGLRLRADRLNGHVKGLSKECDDAGGRAHRQDVRFR